MRLIKACLPICLASLAFLDAAKVVTREGKTYHGKVVWGNQGDLNVTAQDGIHSVRAGDWNEIDFSSSSGKPGLSGLSFRVHQGNWKKFPDLTRLPIDQSGRMTTGAVDLAPLGSAGGQGMSFVFPVGTNLKRWDSPLVEGRSFTISTVLVTNSAPILPKEKKKLPDLVVDEVLDDILAKAVHFNELRTVRLANEELVYHGDDEKPFTGWATERRSGGELWSLRQYLKGKKHGLEAWWHVNGQRWLENVYRDGERDGVWVEWSENGEVKARTNYSGGAKEATVRKDTEVIIAQGGYIDGYALYVQDGWLNFATRVNRKLTIARSDQPLPLNRPVTVTARLFRGGTMTLNVDGRESARVWSPGTMIRMPLDGLQVGFDHNTPVGPYVGKDNRFKGKLEDVRVELEGIGITYAGKLSVSTPGSYQFNLGTDASSRLEIDGALLIDNSDPAKPVNNWGKANLDAGVHDFRLTYAHLMPLKASAGKPASSTPREVGRLDKVWIEDNLPAGAWAQGKFDFMGPPAPVFSGSKSFKLKVEKGQGHLYFERARQPLAPSQEDLLFGYCWLDPNDPPKEIVMQWHDRRGWEHRAYWGENIHNPGAGAHNTPRLWPMGPLPPVGKWARLEVQAIAVGFAPGSPWPTIHGWGFVQAGGTVYWDKLGISSPITVESTDSKYLNLNWYGPGLTEHALSGKADVSEKPWEIDDVAIPAGGVLAKDGSYLPETAKAMNETGVQVGSFTLERKNVAALFFQEISYLQAVNLEGKGSGILLQSGEFLDGEVISLVGDVVTIDSDPVRKKEFKLNEEVVAIVLNQAANPLPRHEFRLKDGSRLFSSAYERKGTDFILEDCSFPVSPISHDRILSLRQGLLPNPLQTAWGLWKGHSASGQLLLQTRDRADRAVVAQVSNYRNQIVAAEEELTASTKELEKVYKEVTFAEKRWQEAKSDMEGKAKVNGEKSKVHSQARQKFHALQAKAKATELEIQKAETELNATKNNRQLPVLMDLINNKSQTLALTDALDAVKVHAAQVTGRIAANKTVLDIGRSVHKSAEAARVSAAGKTSTGGNAHLSAERTVIAKKQSVESALKNLDVLRETKHRPALLKVFQAAESFHQASSRILSFERFSSEAQASAKEAEKLATLANDAAVKATKSMNDLMTKHEMMKTVRAMADKNVEAKTKEFGLAEEALKERRLQNVKIATEVKLADVALEEANRTHVANDQELTRLRASLLRHAEMISETSKLVLPTSFESSRIKEDLNVTDRLLGSLEELIKDARFSIDSLSKRSVSLRKDWMETNATLVDAMKVMEVTEKRRLEVEAAVAKARTAVQEVFKAEQASATAVKSAEENSTIAEVARVNAEKEVNATLVKLDVASGALKSKTLTLKDAILSHADTLKNHHGVINSRNQIDATLASANQSLVRANRVHELAAINFKAATAGEKSAKTKASQVNADLIKANKVVEAGGIAFEKARLGLEASLRGKTNGSSTLMSLAENTHSFYEISLSQDISGHYKAEIEDWVVKATESFNEADNIAKAAEAEYKINARNPDLTAIEKEASREEALALRRLATEKKNFLDELIRVPQKQAQQKQAAIQASVAKITKSKQAASQTTAKAIQGVVAAIIALADEEKNLDETQLALRSTTQEMEGAYTEDAIFSKRTKDCLADEKKAKDEQEKASRFAQTAKISVGSATSALDEAKARQKEATSKLGIASREFQNTWDAREVALKAKAQAKEKAKLADDGLRKALQSLEILKNEGEKITSESNKLKQRLEALEDLELKKLMDELEAQKKNLTISADRSTKMGKSLVVVDKELAAWEIALKSLQELREGLLGLKMKVQDQELADKELPQAKTGLGVVLSRTKEFFAEIKPKRLEVDFSVSESTLKVALANKLVTEKALLEGRMRFKEAEDALKLLTQAQSEVEEVLGKVSRDFEESETRLEVARMEDQERAKLLEKAKATLGHHTEQGRLALGRVQNDTNNLTKTRADYSSSRQALVSSVKVMVQGYKTLFAADDALKASLRDEVAAGSAVIEASRILVVAANHTTKWSSQVKQLEEELNKWTSTEQNSAEKEIGLLSQQSQAATSRLVSSQKNLVAVNKQVVEWTLAHEKALKESHKHHDGLTREESMEANASKILFKTKEVANKARNDYQMINQLFAEKKQARQLLRHRIGLAQRRKEMTQSKLNLLMPEFEKITKP